MAKILVVEDDYQLRQNITEQLELDQHEVRSAWNGVEALVILRSFRPNLILCDIMMPEMDGISFIRSVKRNAHYRSIPFIFLTARVAQQDLIQGLEEGAVDYLFKPFLHRELSLKINNITNQQNEFAVQQIQQTTLEEDPNFQFVRRFTEMLDRHFEDPSLNADRMAEVMNMSLSALQRNLKKYLRRSFTELLKEYRLRKATQYLTQTDQPVQWIADHCGFNSLSYFSFCFKDMYQASPLQYRAMNQVSRVTGDV